MGTVSLLVDREILPVARISGDANELGYAHGSLFAERVRSCWQLYKQILGGDEGLIKSYADSVATYLDDRLPEVAEEIRGIAAGAGLEDWNIFALNARTEIHRTMMESMEAKECTSFYFRASSVLGQNWDFESRCEPLMVLLYVEPTNHPRFVMMTEPGIVGKIGFNEHGVGVCLNILRSGRKMRGVPIHVLLRLVLQQQSFAAARDLIDSIDAETASNLLIGDDQGEGVSIELAGKERGHFSPEGQVVYHTNHYLAVKLDPPIAGSDSSYARCSRAEELISGLNGYGVEDMKRILLDRENDDLPICREFVEDPDPGFELNGTNCAIVMDLPKREMHITPGNPLRHGFEKHSLD